MTMQTGKRSTGWRRAVTGAAIGAQAAGLMVGFGSPAALADPETTTSPVAPSPTAAADTPPTMTADDVLAIIDSDYDTGAGGGQLSNLIHQVLRLRAQGFYPSNANKQAIQKALDYRPNQGPLVEALQETLAYQRHVQAQAQAQPSNPFTIGINQLPPGQQYDPTNPNNTGIFIGGGGTMNQPIVP
jgi:hypothetical protein